MERYKEKPILRLSHDLVVLINQSRYLPVDIRKHSESKVKQQESLSTGLKTYSYNFVDDITSVSVSAALDGISSASVSIATPKHLGHIYFINGRCVFLPMQEIQIFAKGRYLINNKPKYYPIFWGLIDSVTIDDSVPQRNISLSCSGMLKWWQIAQVFLRPSLMDVTLSEENLRTKVDAEARRARFYNLNPYQIVFAMALELSEFSYLLQNEVVGFKILKEALLDSTLRQSVQEEMSQMRTVMNYWEKRFIQREL